MNSASTEGPTTLAKAASGLGIAFGVLAFVEVLGRLLWGQPPPSPQLIQLSVARLEADGSALALRHDTEPAQDVRVGAKGHRPRVVVMGGSSVRHSHHKGPRVNFPTWLSEALPDVEVVNLGAPGMTTLGILGLVRELAQVDAQADLLVVYAGHNDFSEPIFQGTLGGSSLALLPVHTLLGKSWIAAGLRGTTTALVPPRRDDPGQITVTSDARALAWRQATLEDYEANLRAIVARSPAPVVLSTVARSFDHPPVGVLADADHPRCAQTVAGLPRMRMDDPAALARKVDAQCGPDQALAHWYRAQAAARAGDEAAAVEHFAELRRRDPLPLSAPPEAHTVVRRVVDDTDATLWDAAGALGPLPDGLLFDDLLHPSPRGAQRLGEDLAGVVTAVLADAE